ncbi:MAG: GatB/YqeY domain-containing protein [Candidatus Hydrogenedentes bacterium]|nr:GatB/YqeY domain-containing protein [Candidatus Hydrogenedentota bacterium]
MSLKERVQDEMKSAMKDKNVPRLECLRIVKDALLLKEKESDDALTDGASVAMLRAEVKKRQQSLEIPIRMRTSTTLLSSPALRPRSYFAIPLQCEAELLERVRFQAGSLGTRRTSNGPWQDSCSVRFPCRAKGPKDSFAGKFTSAMEGRTLHFPPTELLPQGC